MDRMSLLEYTFQTSLQEDDEFQMDDNFGNNPNPQQPQQQAPNQNQAPMSDLPQGGGMDATAQQQPPMPPEQGAPAPDMMQGDDGFGDEEIEDIDIEEGDDEVVDVTELTDAQDEIGSKVDSMMSKFESFFNTINGLADKVENLSANTDKKIESVKNELEKRVPTDVERMNLRSQDSGPFNISPQEYWKDKSQDNRYDIYSNNNVSPQDEQEYVLTKDDISKEPMNNRIISKTLDTDYPDSLKKIFNY